MLAKKILLGSLVVISLTVGTYGMGKSAGVDCQKDCTEEATSQKPVLKRLCASQCKGELGRSSSLKVATSQPPAVATVPTQGWDEQKCRAECQEAPCKNNAELRAQCRKNCDSKVVSKDCLANVSASGAMGLSAEEILKLNSGHGVTVKHMKPMFEGLESLLPILEQRIKILNEKGEKSTKLEVPNFQKHFDLVKAALQMYAVDLGFDKEAVRNNPDHPINHDPVKFSSVSGGAGTLNTLTCDAALKDAQGKAKGIVAKWSTQAKKRSVIIGILEGMCKAIKIKDPNKDTQTIAAEAAMINDLYTQAIGVERVK